MSYNCVSQQYLTENMAAANTETSLKMSEVKHCLPQLCKALLSASCLSCPNDPIQFLRKVLINFQGHENLQTVDWQQFVDFANRCLATVSLKSRAVGTCSQSARTEILCQLETALNCYTKNLTSLCFRGWKRFILQKKEAAHNLVMKMEMTKRHYENTCQRTVLTKWRDLMKFHKMRRTAAIVKLQTVLNNSFLKCLVDAWHVVTNDSKKRKEYFKRLEVSVTELNSKDQQSSQYQQAGERVDGVSVLPHHLSVKIFQYLELRDWLTCAEVSNEWKSIIQSSSLWSQINFSVAKDWITDNTVEQILRSYCFFVTHVNLRGCQSLKWSSLKYISSCRNLQELNMSECFTISDLMILNITEGCPCLLYLNLSFTHVTNHSLKAIFRNCFSLQYLSLAHCCKFTDEGFLCLTTEKGGRNLTHLNLSGCTQMTVDGFRYISAGCLSLREIVIDDVPTLSDSCVLTLLTRCHRLSSVSLLGCTQLSDAALKAIAEAAILKNFSIEGNNLITDVSLEALCRDSQGLCRLHVADCPGITDDSLKYVAFLRNLQFLDISLSTKVSDTGIKRLTDGSSTHTMHELSISKCSLITDISIRRIARSYCERLLDPAMECLTGSSIQSLDMSGCNIHDQGLATLQKMHLKKIILSECVHITDIGIEKLCKNMRDLEDIDISHCGALTDIAIRSVSFHCRGLITLRMSGCQKITDMAVMYLTSGSQHLRELDISGCILLTDNSLQYLKRICPPLNAIKMICCSNISWGAAKKLQRRVSHWEYSNDKPRRSDCNSNNLAINPKASDKWMGDKHSVMT